MLKPIPVLNDNYIWLYGRENFPLLVIDLPDVAPLLAFLQSHSATVGALLLTHHHQDHTQGVAEFKRAFPAVPVFGPPETASKGATQIVTSGCVEIAGYAVEVIPTGGHTEQHISYVVDGHLFCGDALFSAGCGRVFTGDYAQMFESLQRLKQLPDETLVCAGHEYTLSNIAFAKTLLTQNVPLATWEKKAMQLRAKNQPTLPTTLGLEKQLNPFLLAENLTEFIQWRQAKDIF